MLDTVQWSNAGRTPQRFIVAIFCTLGVIVSYGQRATINVSITRIVSAQIRNMSQDCPSTNETLMGEGIQGGQHDWSEHIQGNILHAFYLGYFVGHVPCGISADYIGGKWTYFMGIAISSIITLGTPVIINHLEWYWVYVSRIVTGLFQGAVYPSMSVLIAHWIPASERATLGALAFSSNSLGTVFGNFFTGILIDYTRYWPTTFYFWAVMGFVWCGFLTIWIYDTPENHPHITDKEKAYLLKNMPHYVKLKVPWKPLLKDKGVWALIIGQIGHDFTLFLMITNMPKYFSDVLHMTIRNITMITSLPFISLWICSILCGRIIDHGIKEKDWNVKWSRSVSTYVAFVLPNSFLCLMVYRECEVVSAAVCFTLAAFFKGPHFAGFKVNHMDITVNFNGVVMSIINTAGCTGGFLSPVIVSYLAPNNKLEEWKLVMWVIFILGFVFTTYYLFMAQGKRSMWDVPLNELDEYKHHEEEEAAMRAERKQHRVEEKQHKIEEKHDKKEQKQHIKEDREAARRADKLQHLQG